MSVRSAGILVYRVNNEILEVMLVHPGGPFWAGKHEGAWSLPKGLYDADEDPFGAARREFSEETGFVLNEGDFLDLGEIKQPSGKIIKAWAVEDDFDVKQLASNTFSLEWPRGAGVVKEYPEVDRAEWFTMDVAKEKILKGQRRFLQRLEQALSDEQKVLDEKD